MSFSHWFGCGLHEDETTFSDFFKTLELDLNYLLGDGSKAITKGKKSVWPPEENTEIYKQRLMCIRPEMAINFYKHLQTFYRIDDQVLRIDFSGPCKVCTSP